MTGTARLNLFLAAAVIGVGAFVYLKPHGGAPQGYPLAAFRPDSAHHIRVERPGMPPVALERRGEAWFLTAPLTARADPVRVQRLLAIAGASASARLPATDLARFDLSRPVASVTIDQQRFDFGMVNPVSGEQYVLTADAVYTVARSFGAALPGSAADAVDKQLLGHGEVPESIELAAFGVFREEGKWVMRPPAGDLSQDDIQRWVDDWRHASALRVEPAGPARPTGLVRMRFRDGTALSLGILARDPELALLRPDEKLVYYLFKGKAPLLLSPPQLPRDERGVQK